MNFANSWKKQHEGVPMTPNSPSFLNTVNSRAHAPLSFQKTHILPCSIYDQRSPKGIQSDLNPIYERSESLKSSQQNTFRAGPNEEPDNAVNILDISEELLLSQKNLASRRQLGTTAICPAHQKSLDIICLVDRTRICSHCALFGEHKDHNFKSDAQFLDELQAQSDRLNRLQQKQDTFFGAPCLQDQWRQLQQQCRSRERELLEELSLEFARLLQRIQTARREIESSIHQQAQSVQQVIEQQAHCKQQVEGGKAFGTWLQEGRRIVQSMRKNFDTAQFENCYGDYDTYSWLQGECLLGQERESNQRVKDGVQRAIEDMRLNLNQHALQNLASSLYFVSQIQLPSEAQTSLTSLDDLHKNLATLKTQGNQKCDNEFLDFREFARFRNSECLQPIQEPGRTSIGLIGKAQRMSAKAFSKKAAFSSSKKENKPTGDTFNLSLLQRQKSISRLQTSIFSSSHSKMKVLSPKLPKPRPDPMRLISDYERNEQTTFLNLADCNLNEDSLAYFLERAGKARMPSQVNLQRNNLSANGFSKLLPYLVGCTKINMANCGLGEGCLQALLRTKALRRLEECNLLGNDINTMKNRAKLEELKRIGIKVICG